jgi:hypothetical protein
VENTGTDSLKQAYEIGIGGAEEMRVLVDGAFFVRKSGDGRANGADR